ncbi:MAG: M28 family peptidase [Proteobacteria bacterium]|nr:M28 family peptidase [Pseudomonadota bacterium]
MKLLKGIPVFLITFSIICLPAVQARENVFPEVSIETKELVHVVEFLTGLRPYRNFKNVNSLNKAADFISRQLGQNGLQPSFQPYLVDGKGYKNVVASLGPANADRLIIGAHYDVYEEQDGADDNASGVAGLLTLARLLKPHENELSIRIEFVAFTLEEPPFFRTEQMGSFVHAKSVSKSAENVIGMISLEMIGYFTEEPDSQEFPVSVMKLIYPTTGNFIAVVSNFSSSHLKNHFKKSLSLTSIDVETLAAPSSIKGVDFSDHLNYWKHDMDAIMITDTAFFRNPHYHKKTDTIETLDFEKMKEVIKGVYWGVLELSKQRKTK